MASSPLTISTLSKTNIDLLRIDLLDKPVSGNKWYKLKYNLEAALKGGNKCILTFGGAFSNHIYAVAAAAQWYGLESIGIIRGEEMLPLNHTLAFAKSLGMELHFISRAEYRRKGDPVFIDELHKRFGKFYLIPEGGTNDLALKGMAEVVKETSIEYDTWVVPVGTGGTLAGISSALKHNQQVIGFSALKGAQGITSDIEKLLKKSGRSSPNWSVNHDYHFGGYAKMAPLLYQFIKNFRRDQKILLDPVYTSKMMYGLFDLIHKGAISSNKKILAVHTGGLQGWAGMVNRYSFIDKSFPLY